MAARVQIQIEAQDAASGVLRAITSQFGALGRAVSDMADMFSRGAALQDLYQKGLTDTSVSVEQVRQAEEAAAAATARFAEQIALLAVDFLKTAIEETAKYAEEVHALTLASGASYEEASRLLQVLGDYNITAQDVTTATRKMTENGFAPTVQTLATLSDQYNSLNTAQEKNAFLVENLGRGGAEWAKVLALGSDAILELNAGVSENLILNKEAYESAEKYRLALDELDDSWIALKTSFGVAAFEPLANLFSLISKNIDDSTESLGAFLSNAIPFVAIWRSASNAIEIYDEKQLEAMSNMEGMKESNQGVTTSLLENAAAIEQNTVNYDSLIGSIIDYQDEIDRYNERGSELQESQSSLLEQQALLSAELEKAVGAYGANSAAAADVQAQLDGVNGKIDENKKKLAENEEAHRRWAAQTVFAFAQARAAADGSISQMEGDLLIQAGQALGLFDESTAKTMQSVNQAFDTLDTSNAQDVIATLKEQLDELVAGTYMINIGVNQPELPTAPVPPTNPPPGGNPQPFSSQSTSAVGATTNYFYGNVTYVTDGVVGEILEYR